jgi:hypothetical protein
VDPCFSIHRMPVRLISLPPWRTLPPTPIVCLYLPRKSVAPVTAACDGNHALGRDRNQGNRRKKKAAQAALTASQLRTLSGYLLIESSLLAPPLSIFTLMTWIEFLSAYTWALS